MPKHRQARLYPSEVVTLALMFALKGVGNRAFYRWFVSGFARTDAPIPTLSDAPSFDRTVSGLGVIDSYGIELIHPVREGRIEYHIGRKGLSSYRWIVGGKLCLLLNQEGLIVAWDCATANVADNTFQRLIRQFEGEMIALADQAFHAK